MNNIWSPLKELSIEMDLAERGVIRWVFIKERGEENFYQNSPDLYPVRAR